MGNTKFSAALVVATLALASVPSSAHADATVHPRGGYIVVDRGPHLAPPPSIGPGLVLFFNRNAATYTRGEDDSTSNKSSVPIQTVTLGAWSCGDAKWQQFMTCVKDMYSPFDVKVTDVDPGSAPHIETHVGGVPGAMKTSDYPSGLPCSQSQGCVGGIAPLGCFGGIDNAITYVFSDASFYQCDVQSLCETAAQESAHAFGFDHEAYCPDPMTYDSGCGDKKFRDYDAPCGEYEDQASRPCTCPGTGSKQNSYQLLMDMFGPAVSMPDNEPPTVAIDSPANGATVSAGFAIACSASDDSGVARVELWIDGAMSATKTVSPWSFSAPTTLAPGAHTIVARAYDGDGEQASATVTVTLAAPAQCQDSGDCASGQVCQNDACVPGPSTPGGLGSDCDDGSDCSSGMCASGPGGMKCTQACVPGASPSSCPDGFECLSTGTGGACWPGDGSGGGGGDDDDDGAGGADDGGLTGGCGCSVGAAARHAGRGAIALGLLLAAWPLARRRRRS